MARWFRVAADAGLQAIYLVWNRFTRCTLTGNLTGNAGLVSARERLRHQFLKGGFGQSLRSGAKTWRGQDSPAACRHPRFLSSSLAPRRQYPGLARDLS